MGSAMKYVVVFKEGQYPKVLYTQNPEQFDLNTTLVNPVLPRGVPPHRWKMGDGCIEVLPEVTEVAQVASKSDLPVIQVKPPFITKTRLLKLAIALLAALVIKHLLHP